jgi:hypothetical protein
MYKSLLNSESMKQMLDKQTPFYILLQLFALPYFNISKQSYLNSHLTNDSIIDVEKICIR